MEFEWDQKKADENFAKHKIDFEEATEIFDDSYLIEESSDSQIYEEVRFKTIGQIGSHICVVVYTPRGKRTRLISARRANKQERRRYRLRSAAS